MTRRTAPSHAPRKIVVIGKAREFVPIVVDAIDEALVRPRERGFELQIIRRIGEDEIDAFRRQPGHRFDAIAFDDFVEGKRAGREIRAGHDGARRRNPSTHHLDLGFWAGRSGTLLTHEHRTGARRDCLRRAEAAHGASSGSPNESCVT